MNRYPWEVTLDEWLGPRVISSPIPTVTPAAPSSTLLGQRKPLDDAWVQHTTGGPLLYATQNSQQPVGALPFRGVWSIDPRFRGRGLGIRALADHWSTYGRGPEEWARNSLYSSLSPDGERAFVRTYLLSVEQAVTRGVDVSDRVLTSAQGTEQRLAQLKVGDYPDHLTPKLRRKFEKKLRNRYRLVSVSAEFAQWLRSKPEPSLSWYFERVLVQP